MRIGKDGRVGGSEVDIDSSDPDIDIGVLGVSERDPGAEFGRDGKTFQKSKSGGSFGLA